MLANFEANARNRAEIIALQLSDDKGLRSFTYGEFFGAAGRIADFLAATGSAEKPIALLMNYDAFWVMAFFGIYRFGATVVPLDILLSEEEVANLVRHSGAGAVLTDEANRSKLQGLSLRVVDPQSEGLFGTGRSNQGHGDGPRRLPQAPEPTRSADAPLRNPPASGEQPMVVIYTSGTTGDPKGVQLTEANFEAELDALMELVPFGPNDHLLSVLPLHHVLALLTGVLAPLYVGGRVTFLSTVERSGVQRALQEMGVTVFVCVPQFFYLLHANVWSEIRRKPAAARLLISGLMKVNLALRRYARVNLGRLFFGRIHASFGPAFRFFAVGGSYFDPAVVLDLAAWGLNVVQAYGLTETSGACSAASFRDQQWGSVGKPLRGVSIRILDPNERGEGELAIQGPVVTSGYFKNEEETRKAFRDGWFLSGDLGYRDRHGSFHITGRSKEVIVLSSGKNIYPEELERYYCGHPSIKEVAIVAQMGPGGQEQLAAIVVPDFAYLKEQKVANSTEVIRFEIESLASRLPSHKRITALQVRSEPLPRTTTRKLKRRELQTQLKPGARKAASEPLADRVAQEAVRFAEGLGKAPDSPTLQSNLELDLGLDSLQRVELFSHLEMVFGIALSHDEASAIYTLQDLSRAFQPEAGESGSERPAGRNWSRMLAQDEPSAEPFLRDRPVSHWVVQCLRVLFRTTFGALLFDLKVEGKEKLPAAGPYLICPNHLSYLDGLFFAAAFPRHVFDRVFYLGQSEYFQKGFSRRFAEWIHIVPLDPDTHLVRALRAGAMGLRQKRILCVFPEGTRSIDGQVKPFRQGAAILAREAGAAVVPAAIIGTFEVMPRHRSWPQPHPVRIVFGDPISPEAFQSDAELTAALQKEVEALLARASRR